MVSNLLETDVENVLDTAFGDADEELLVVDPGDDRIAR